MSDCITVSGPPGSGTSTLCRLLQEELGHDYVYAGQIFRDQAEQRGMSLKEFGALCEVDDQVDRGLDDEQIRLLKEALDFDRSLILEGRLSGWLAHRNNIPALKVYVDCDEVERVRRIVERDGGDDSEQAEATRIREESEATRYNHYYGIDLDDMAPYDLVLDSTNKSPDQLRADVLAALRSD